jgi:hypothetical protein
LREPLFYILFSLFLNLADHDLLWAEPPARPDTLDVVQPLPGSGGGNEGDEGDEEAGEEAGGEADEKEGETKADNEGDSKEEKANPEPALTAEQLAAHERDELARAQAQLKKVSSACLYLQPKHVCSHGVGHVQEARRRRAALKQRTVRVNFFKNGYILTDRVSGCS